MSQRRVFINQQTDSNHVRLKFNVLTVISFVEFLLDRLVKFTSLTCIQISGYQREKKLALILSYILPRLHVTCRNDA